MAAAAAGGPGFARDCASPWSMAMGALGKKDISVGGTSVPVGAFGTLQKDELKSAPWVKGLMGERRRGAGQLFLEVVA